PYADIEEVVQSIKITKGITNMFYLFPLVLPMLQKDIITSIWHALRDESEKLLAEKEEQTHLVTGYLYGMNTATLRVFLSLRKSAVSGMQLIGVTFFPNTSLPFLLHIYISDKEEEREVVCAQ
ncbi:hypothetical protein ACJX0J_029195, partial [Zea mays]